VISLHRDLEYDTTRHVTVDDGIDERLVRHTRGLRHFQTFFDTNGFWKLFWESFCLTTRAYPASNRTFISIFIIYITYKSPSSIIQSFLPRKWCTSTTWAGLIGGILGFLTDTTATSFFIFHSFPQTGLKLRVFNYWSAVNAPRKRHGFHEEWLFPFLKQPL